MSTPQIMEPSACTWCGIARRPHGRQFADAAGYHEWAPPTDGQIKARMQARRLALTVAREGALPVPVGPKPQSPGSFPPALPWARLMDREDLADFLDELAASAITHASGGVALAEVESTIARWRLIAEAQHGHNTAPGPDSVTQSFAPVAAPREVPSGETDPARRAAWRMLSREGPHDSPLHQDHRVPHDMPDPEERLLSGDELGRAVRGHLFGGAS